MLILGIDPGLTGAYAALTLDGLTVVADLPTVEKAHKSGKRSEFSAHLFHDCVASLPKIDMAVIEHVSASPQMGTVSAFRFGECFGGIVAVLACCGIRTEFVRPATWKKAMGLNSEAEVSRAKVLELFPDASQHFARKADHNRAEAALLAEYGRRELWRF